MSTLSLADAIAVQRHCTRPVWGPGSHVHGPSRCGSRDPHVCPSCAERFRLDWRRILYSGCLPSADVAADDLLGHSFYLLTLTAPSFGTIHRVPKHAGAAVSRCRCGVTHTLNDRHLMGVPVGAFDYQGAVAWNMSMPALWDQTRLRLRRAMPGYEYAAVREWQARGLIHMHIILRVPTAQALTAAQIEAIAASARSGQTRWGRQSDCQEIAALGAAAGDTARAVGYLAKTLGYTSKSWSSILPSGPAGPWLAHRDRLYATALRTPCPRCPALGPAACTGAAHRRLGASRALVTISRPGDGRPGWSLAGLNRGRVQQERIAWARRQQIGRAHV